jgi:hypothetical protein
MGLRTLLAAGLTSLAVAGGATWGYVHYSEIFGEGTVCGTSECAPAACSASSGCASECTVESCCQSEEVAAKSCCESPSRTAAVAQEAAPQEAAPQQQE